MGMRREAHGQYEWSGTVHPKLRPNIVPRSQSESRRLANLHHRQVSLSFQVAHHETKLRSTPAPDPRLRRGTETYRRPVPLRFKSRLRIRRSKAGVDFPGRSSAESLVGTVLIVPRRVEAHLTPHCPNLQRNSNELRALVLHGANESLDRCDTPLLTHRTKPRMRGDITTPRGSFEESNSVGIRDHRDRPNPFHDSPGSLAISSANTVSAATCGSYGTP